MNSEKLSRIIKIKIIYRITWKFMGFYICSIKTFLWQYIFSALNDKTIRYIDGVYVGLYMCKEPC